MGPEETVNPLARGLSSATFLFSHSTFRLLELKNPKKKKERLEYDLNHFFLFAKKKEMKKENLTEKILKKLFFLLK